MGHKHHQGLRNKTHHIAGMGKKPPEKVLADIPGNAGKKHPPKSRLKSLADAVSKWLTT